MFDIKNKDFREDLRYLIEKLQSKKNFAFSKYADGELHILANKPVNNGEFWFVPEKHQNNRQEMIDSFRFQHESYYVGVSCPCCIGGPPVHSWMKAQSGQHENHLTWANIFVNANYNYYLNNMVPEYSQRKIVLISNSDSNLENLPFEIEKHFMIGKNAWVDNHALIEEIKNYIITKKVEDTLFLFCAGPFGNILVHQLFEFNQNNTYIDIGSTLNPLLLGDEGLNRGYLRGSDSITKFCTWGE
jgi:hypothetical protein